jgi:hypothetical protein
MGIDVTVKNRQLFKKALKLGDITLGKYTCGTSDEYARNTCEPGDGDLIVYNPEKIGRGVIVSNWNSNIKDEISLRVNFLSTRYDMEMFYEIIRNVMHVWKAKNFEQDGGIYTEDDIDALCKDNKELSLRYMVDMCKDKKTDDSAFTIFGAMFPLDLDTDLLINFGFKKDEEGYADYLHGLQSMDVYYAVPAVYRRKDKESAFWGAYSVTATVDTVFPLKPRAPLFFKNPDTNEDLKCDFFVVSLYSLAQKKTLAIMSFEDFCRLAGVGNCQTFDKNHVVIKGISEEKMAEMAASEYVNPLEK